MKLTIYNKNLGKKTPQKFYFKQDDTYYDLIVFHSLSVQVLVDE